MDDAFVVLHADENDKFLGNMNRIDTNIKSTQVNIFDNRLSFFGLSGDY